jgi:DNA (cytosine-5)-methyltransferase 1
MKSVELFAGAGGLALGISAVGFKHKAVVEWDHDACNTIRENQRLGCAQVQGWPVHEMDVSKFDFQTLGSGIDLLAGGPPCQPFSLAGKHRGHQDERNMFPQVFRAVRTLAPRALLIENVKGLTRASFSDYLNYIVIQLAYPEILRRESEQWHEHLARLKKHQASGKTRGLEYDVQYRLVNAANYGVPQKRERVIIIGFRKDLGIEWTYPGPTHSHEALLHSQWVTGEYWERHKVAKKDRPEEPKRYRGKIEALKQGVLPMELPWKTVRDALVGLPDPEKSKSHAFANHVFNPGARSYPGHTGSPLDEPAKTLKAGDHGVPGGENMLARPDGSVRYFTVRESARLQTFPDDYIFMGAWSEAMRQLGNAVPMELAKVMATRIKQHLGTSRQFKASPRHQGSGERRIEEATTV